MPPDRYRPVIERAQQRGIVLALIQVLYGNKLVDNDNMPLGVKSATLKEKPSWLIDKNVCVIVSGIAVEFRRFARHLHH